MVILPCYLAPHWCQLVFIDSISKFILLSLWVLSVCQFSVLIISFLRNHGNFFAAPLPTTRNPELDSMNSLKLVERSWYTCVLHRRRYATAPHAGNRIIARPTNAVFYLFLSVSFLVYLVLHVLESTAQPQPTNTLTSRPTALNTICFTPLLVCTSQYKIA